MTDRDPTSADPFGQIADEFVDAFRQGKRPSVEEFARRYPLHAAEIRELLPALVLMEKAKTAPGSTGEPGPAPPQGSEPLLQLAEYQLLREVGRGGMGVVYEAQQLSLGRHVAIKVLPRHALLDPKQVGRFQREARAAARLHHTNIVPVYGVGEQNGVHFYVMQYIQGLGLDLVLGELRRLRGKSPSTPGGAPAAAETASAVGAARAILSGCRASAATGSFTPGAAPVGAPSGAPSVDTSASARLPGRGDPTPLSDSGRQYWHGVARVGMQVADALAHAASQGVLHRDIKPSNLLLDDTGNVWVTDFGLAKDDTADDNLTNTGDVIGTLRYMAPERFQGHSDIRSDVYSLGLTLYEMLVLRPAFGGADRNALVKAVLHDDPVPPRALDRAVPRDIETVVLKAMARDPDQRYQTPADIADDLKRFVEDQPVRARRISSAERVWRSCRRNPLVASLLAGIVVVFLVGFAGVTWQWFEAAGARVAAEQERDAARWREYRANMAAVASALGLNNMTEARRLLEACHPAHRGWEWRHFMTRLDGARAVLPHGAPVWYASFNRDGTRLATSSKDGRLRVWDTATGRELFQKQLDETKPVGRYGMVEILPDDRVVYVGGGGTARIWHPLAPGTPDVVLPIDDTYGVKLSPDRAYAAWSGTAPGGKAWLWDVRHGRAPVPLPDTPSSAIAVSRNDRLVAMTVEGNEIVIWDVARGAVVQRLGRNRVWHNALAFHPRTDLVVSASLHPECELRLWGPDGKPLRSQSVHRNTITFLAFSPDGSRLASSSLDQTIGLWHGDTLQPVGLLRGHTGKVIQVEFTPDGKRLVSLSEDLSLRLWDAAGGEPVAVLQGHTELVNRIAVSPAGDTIASAADDGTVRLWDREPRDTLRGHEKYVYDVCFSPDGARLASAAWDGSVRLWDATTHQELAELKQETAPNRAVQSVAWSRDGRLLAVAARDRFVHLWDAKEKTKLRTLDVATWHWKADIRAAFNPDTSLLATGSCEGRVRLWNPTTGEKLAEWDGRHRVDDNDAFTSDVAFSPDGRFLATAGADNLIRLWRVSDVLAGRTAEPHAALRGHTELVHRLVWGKDGTWLASASQDRSVRLWSVEGAKQLAELPHGSVVYGLALSPDETRLASGCADNTIRVWDLATGEQVAELRGHDAYVKAVAFSPDGERLVSASGDHTLRFWDTVSVQERARRTAAVRRP